MQRIDDLEHSLGKRLCNQLPVNEIQLERTALVNTLLLSMRCLAMRVAVLVSACALLLTSSWSRSSLSTIKFKSAHADERTQSERPSPGTGFQSLFQHISRLQPAPLTLPSILVPEPRFALQGKDEDTEGRGDWFMFQRTYGSNEIPGDARRLAWKAQTGFQTSARFRIEATAAWRPIGPTPTISAWYDWWGPTSGRVNSIAVSPSNSRVVLLGTSTGGIWRSTDAGATFIPASDDQADLEVGYIAFSKSNPSIAYAGMGDTVLGYLGSGVLKSTDEGASWTRVSNSTLPSPGSIARLEIDPVNSNRLFVAQYSVVSGSKVTAGGVYRSTDGGVNWSRVLAGGARDVILDPSNSRNLYAGLSRIDPDVDPPFGLYHSTDGGDTWSNVFTAQYDLLRRRDIRVAISPSDSRRIYVYYGGYIADVDAHLRVSTDGGATWSDHYLWTVDLGQIGYNTYLFADPRDALTVYLGSRDIYKSTDGGNNWTNVTRNFYDSGQGFTYAPGGSKTHTDQHALAFSPNDPNELYAGNDGGVSKTTDGGTTFQSLNAGLTLTQFVGLSLHPTNAAISYGGTQDNGTQQRIGNSRNWREVISGDGGRSVIDPLDPSVVFMTYVRGDVFRLSGNGQSLDAQIGWNGAFGEAYDGARMAFYPPFVGNGVDATLYFGTWRLFISTDLGNSWFAPASFADLTKGYTAAGVDVLSAIAVARSNTSVIYTGSVQGRVMASTNVGRIWSDITQGLPNRSITSITVDPSNAATAYVTLSGFGSSHVFKTTNTGNTWTDISAGLPDVPANTLMFDPIDHNTLYLGTDIGVFRSTTSGAGWRGFNKGMPPVVVHEFASQPSGLIQVATYGRGAYELVTNPPPVIASVVFDGKKHLTISGSSFGDAPRVLINGEDRSDHIDTSSDSEVKLIGKIKKLGLRAGNNTVQVVTSDTVSSNVFTLSL
jgi:photosystem II stability/assembly factor-like uncharacterized protein